MSKDPTLNIPPAETPTQQTAREARERLESATARHTAFGIDPAPEPQPDPPAAPVPNAMGI